MTWWTKKSPYHDYDMVIADGSIRSGKTVAMINSFLDWSLSTFEDEQFIIAGKSMGALKRNVLNPMFKILAAKGIDYDYQRSSDEPHIKIGTNIYYLFGANNERSQDTLQGLTAAGAYGDEAALFPESFVKQMIGRCSVEGSKVFMNCNPQGPYHWFKLDYIDKAKEKRIVHLHFTMVDNLSLSPKVRERYERMFSGVFYQRYILGLWVLAEGIIYDMFNKVKHTVESILRNYEKYHVSVDYGTNNPMTFGLWGLHKDVWYKVKEYHYDGRARSKQKTDSEYKEDLLKFIGNLKIESVIVDPSASSFIAEIRNVKYGDGYKIKVKRARNDVLDGIRNVSTAIVDGKIKYNDCCEETFREFSSYAWDEKAQERGEDKPKKVNDHHMDGDRYFVNTIIYGKTKAKAVPAIA